MRQLIGGSIGFVLGGPLGAVLGTVLAGMSGNSPSRQSGPGQQLQVTFFVAVFSMLAKMVSSDGEVSPEEITTVEGFMKNQLRMNAAAQNFGKKVFYEAMHSTATFGEFAQQFHKSFAAQPQLMHSMMEMLLIVAMADKVLHPEEEKLLNEAQQLFGMHADEFRHLKEKYIPNTQRYYAILGCDANASMDEVKQAYRKLATEYHPDKLMSKGLPDEFHTFAKTKFQEIQEAYDKIKSQNG